MTKYNLEQVFVALLYNGRIVYGCKACSVKFLNKGQTQSMRLVSVGNSLK